MTVVSNKEFITNQDVYFDMAINEQVVIQRGDNLFVIQNYGQNSVKLKPRQGWAETAKKIAISGNEETFFPEVFEDEDFNWWQWEKK